MHRVSVVGISGSGKSTLAGKLAELTGRPHLELDALFHQPNWTPADPASFRAEVAAFTDGDTWIVDGFYGSVTREVVWAKADTVVWLDPSRGRVMFQVIRRTIGRIALRQELWNGNRESWRGLFSCDPQKSVVLWAWTQHGARRQQLEEAVVDAANTHLTFVRLRTRKESRRFLVTQSPD